MTVTAHIDRRDLLYLDELMGKAEARSVEFANDMVKHIAVVFGRSAKKHTGPDKASKLKSMKKKHRVRRVESLPISKQEMLGQFWYKDRQAGNIFSTKKKISRRSRFASTVQGDEFGPLAGGDNARLIPLKRGIKAWDKKKRRYVWYGTTKSLGLHEGVRRNKSTAPISTRIPNAGAAKAGWMVMLNNLGQRKGNNIGRITSRVGRTRRIKGRNPVIQHLNNVDYVSNISPGVVPLAMSNAVKHFKFNEKRAFNRMVRSEFRMGRRQIAKIAKF